MTCYFKDDELENLLETRPSRCAGWIIKGLRDQPTVRQTNRPTGNRGALAHLKQRIRQKITRDSEKERRRIKKGENRRSG